MGDPKLQAKLHSPILAQVKDLGTQALFKVANMANPTQTFKKIQQRIKEPYLQFIDSLQDAVEKQITNTEARNHLILQLSRDNANKDC